MKLYDCISKLVALDNFSTKRIWTVLLAFPLCPLPFYKGKDTGWIQYLLSIQKGAALHPCAHLICFFMEIDRYRSKKWRRHCLLKVTHYGSPYAYLVVSLVSLVSIVEAQSMWYQLLIVLWNVLLKVYFRNIL